VVEASAFVPKVLRVIGVHTDEAQHPAVREFFELFKTPWEFCEKDRAYDVVITTHARDASGYRARLTIVFQTEIIRSGDFAAVDAKSEESIAVVTYEEWGLPIYGKCLAFLNHGDRTLAHQKSGMPVMCRVHEGTAQIVSIGFDLFGEVETLLTVGQPATFAAVPTLDLYIALIRNLIVRSGIELVEIPPVPAGYKFIACLTHDVDHPRIADHKWDHTMFGFLFRATAGSMRSFLGGRLGWRDVLTNWITALKLPLVHLGVAKDFWAGFEERFRRVEGTKRSTYFLIPYKGVPGEGKEGRAKPARAAAYRVEQLKVAIEKILEYGCEVGLHGIDAWCDDGKAGEELAEIRRLTGAAEVGVRMHWLYFNPESPRILDQAGACYDSTVGYNNTVGYRAGTTQAYRPFGCDQLLEMPLHAMDTAMFYPHYLHLTQEQGIASLQSMIDFAAHNGGTLTVNWHDRSLAPERLWNESYKALIDNVHRSKGWFATASQARQWFQLRRSATFRGDHTVAMTESAQTVQYDESLPGLICRTYRVVDPLIGKYAIVDHSLNHPSRPE
jgi:hypothetical protein